MNIKVLLSHGYILTVLVGSVCPIQVAAAITLPEPTNEHVEMMEVAMTPVIPMTLATPILMISASHTMPLPPSGNCQTGLCIGGHSNPQSFSLLSVSVRLVKSAAPAVPLSPVLIYSVALPAPPDGGNVRVAQVISTVVLRV